jgi:hypothetical protein
MILQATIFMLGVSFTAYAWIAIVYPAFEEIAKILR